MANQIKGKIVSVSPDGDLVSDISADQLDGVPRDESVSISCDGHATAGIFTTDHQEPKMTFLAVINVDDQLQISLVGARASEFLGINVGSVLVLKW